MLDASYLPVSCMFARRTAAILIPVFCSAGFDGAEINAKSHHKETGRLKYFPRGAARNRIGAKKF